MKGKSLKSLKLTKLIIAEDAEDEVDNSSLSSLSSSKTTFDDREESSQSSFGSSRTLADLMSDLELEETKEKVAQRKLLIDKQCEEILLRISENQDPELLKKGLKDYKADALEMALKDVDQYKYSKENLNVLEDVFLEKFVGKVKTRSVEFAAEKDEGKSSGRFVLKVDDEDAQSLKSKTPWIEKYEDVSHKRNEGEEICEYTAGVLMKLLMGENAPKARLYKEGDKVKLMFKIIPKFTTLEQIGNKEKELLNAEDAERFVVAYILMANYDTNFGNVGLREDVDGRKYLSGIDPEKSLSFKTIAKPRNQKIEDIFDFEKVEPSDEELAINAKEHIFRDSLYKSLFSREDSYKKIAEAADKVNIERLRKAFRLALENVEDAYGADIFTTQKVKDELRRRIDFPEGVEITKDLFVDAVISNISKLKNGVTEMARAQTKAHKRKVENVIQDVKGGLNGLESPNVVRKEEKIKNISV